MPCSCGNRGCRCIGRCFCQRSTCECVKCSLIVQEEKDQEAIYENAQLDTYDPSYLGENFQTFINHIKTRLSELNILHLEPEIPMIATQTGNGLLRYVGLENIDLFKVHSEVDITIYNLIKKKKINMSKPDSDQLPNRYAVPGTSRERAVSHEKRHSIQSGGVKKPQHHKSSLPRRDQRSSDCRSATAQPFLQTNMPTIIDSRNLSQHHSREKTVICFAGGSQQTDRSSTTEHSKHDVTKPISNEQPMCSDEINSEQTLDLLTDEEKLRRYVNYFSSTLEQNESTASAHRTNLSSPPQCCSSFSCGNIADVSKKSQSILKMYLTNPDSLRPSYIFKCLQTYPVTNTQISTPNECLSPICFANCKCTCVSQSQEIRHVVPGSSREGAVSSVKKRGVQSRGVKKPPASKYISRKHDQRSSDGKSATAQPLSKTNVPTIMQTRRLSKTRSPKENTPFVDSSQQINPGTTEHISSKNVSHNKDNRTISNTEKPSSLWEALTIVAGNALLRFYSDENVSPSQSNPESSLSSGESQEKRLESGIKERD